LKLILARATVEALIFAASEPLPGKSIAEIIGVEEPTVIRIIDDLIDLYIRENRGIQIHRIAGGYQFRTNPECGPYVEKLQKAPRNVGLSQAAVETLAIIAYKQPVTRAEIEALRGVTVERPLNTLLEKELVEEAGRKEVPGRPILYRTTPKFLNHFGLNSLNDLPAIPEWIDPGDIYFNSDIVEAEKE
jgi:segregation and condensation protein B